MSALSTFAIVTSAHARNIISSVQFRLLIQSSSTNYYKIQSALFHNPHSSGGKSILLLTHRTLRTICDWRMDLFVVRSYTAVEMRNTRNFEETIEQQYMDFSVRPLVFFFFECYSTAVPCLMAAAIASCIRTTNVICFFLIFPLSRCLIHFHYVVMCIVFFINNN